MPDQTLQFARYLAKLIDYTEPAHTHHVQQSHNLRLILQTIYEDAVETFRALNLPEGTQPGDLMERGPYDQAAA